MTNHSKTPVTDFIGKMALSLFLYLIISSYVLGTRSLDGLSQPESDVRTVLTYSLMFLVASITPLTAGICIAKIPKSNRGKPLGPFLNRILIATWVIAAMGLYFNWYGYNRVAEHYSNVNTEETQPLPETVNSILERVVSDLTRQLPLRIDKDTYLVSVTYLNNQVYYKYQFDKILAQDIDPEKFRAKMDMYTRNRFCTDPNGAFLRELAPNTKYHWEYADAEGKVLSASSMVAVLCP